MYKEIKIFIYTTVFGIFQGCNLDPEILMQRVPYEGNELRIDGYYYYQNNISDYSRTHVLFLFRNGVMFNPFSYWTNDINEVEKKLTVAHENGWFEKELEGWGVFNINENRLKYEKWSVEGGHSLIYTGRIENDTTFHLLQCVDPLRGILPMYEICHFKKFSPKPDSIKSFIK